MSVTLRIKDEKLKIIDDIAKVENTTRSKILQDLVDQKIDLYNWQVQQIQEGIKDANTNNWSRDTEILKLLLD